MDVNQARLLILLEAQFYYIQDSALTSQEMLKQHVHLPPAANITADEALRLKKANASIRLKLRSKP